MTKKIRRFFALYFALFLIPALLSAAGVELRIVDSKTGESTLKCAKGDEVVLAVQLKNSCAIPDLYYEINFSSDISKISLSKDFDADYTCKSVSIKKFWKGKSGVVLVLRPSQSKTNCTALKIRSYTQDATAEDDTCPYNVSDDFRTIATISLKVNDAAEKGTYDLTFGTATFEEYEGDPDQVPTMTNATLQVLFNFNANEIAGKTDEDTPMDITPDTSWFIDKDGANISGIVTAISADGRSYGTDAITTTNGATVTLTDTGINYKPAENWYGMDSFYYKATDSTAAYNDTNIISVTVNSVIDDPVITVASTTNFEEGESPTVTVTFSDVEQRDFAAFTKTVTLNGTELTGTWDGLTFTADSALDYDQVAHPNSSDTKSLSVTIKDDNSVANASSDVDVLDTDRMPSRHSVTISPAEAYTDDDLVAALTYTIDDPDGDTITPSYAWASGDKNATGNTLGSDNTAKGETWTVTASATVAPYGIAIPAFEDTTASVTIVNSTPSLPETASWFVQKTDVFGNPVVGNTTTGKYCIQYTDADGYSDFSGITVDDNSLDGIDTVRAAIDETTGLLVFTFNITDTTTEKTDCKFAFTATDADNGESTPCTVTIKYQENPAPILTEPATLERTYAEVDDDGNGTTFTAFITATDDNTVEAVPASGITKFTWSLKDADGNPVTDGVTIEPSEDPAIPTTGTTACTGACKVTLSYDLLNGADRPASGSYTLSVYATDGGEADSNAYTWTFNVTDVDRAPAAPTALTLSPDADLVAGKIVTAAVPEDGTSTDPDGDTVSYKYRFNVVNETLGVELSGTSYDGTFPITRYLIKNDVLKVSVIAIADPKYSTDDPLESEAFAANTLTVGNTAPSIVTAYTADSPLQLNETEGDEAYTIEISSLGTAAITPKDIDWSDGIDFLVYTITDGADTDYATVSVTDTTITITPRKYMVSKEAQSFTLQVSDGEDFATVDVFYELNAINHAPIISLNDVYVVPAECGTEMSVSFNVTMGGGDSEQAQNIRGAAIVVSSDENGIMDGVPSIAYYNNDDGTRTITIKFKTTSEAAAQMGAEAVLSVTVTDDGVNTPEPNVNEVTDSFKIVLGATPWYPLFSVPCDNTEHTIHQVKLVSDSETVTLIVDGDTILPTHYYYQGCKGLASGDVYTLYVYEWDAVNGASPTLCNDPTADDSLLTVPEYTLPETPTLTYSSVDNTFSFSIDAPLSASYVLSITKDNTAYKTITKDFIPNGEGLIIPSTALALDIYEAGSYTATVYGVNPRGSGEASDAVTFTVEDADVELEWPADGVFAPDAQVIRIDNATTDVDVNFSWPVVSAAVSYVIFIENQIDEFATEIQTTKNTVTLNLDISAGSTSFNWWVCAVDADGSKLNSTAHDFTVLRNSQISAVDFVFFDGSAATAGRLYLNFIDTENIPDSVEVQLAHIAGTTVTWYEFVDENSLSRPVLQDAKLYYLDLSAALPGVEISVGDFVYIRFHKGSLESECKIYTIKAVQ